MLSQVGDNLKPQRALVISTLGDFFCLRAETMQNRLREALAKPSFRLSVFI